MDKYFCLKTSVIWRFIGYIIFVIKIIVPLVIIVIGVIDLSKCVVSGKDDEIKITFQNLLKKIIIGIIIFFIPTITKLVFSLISEASKSMEYAEGCISCLTAPLSDVCKNAVGTAAKARKTQNEELYNKFYEFVHKKKKPYVDYSDEKSGGNPKPDDPSSSSTDHTPSPILTEAPDGAISASFTASDGKTYNYWLMVPKNKTNNIPLIVFLHGGLNEWEGSFNNLVTINNPAIDAVRYYNNDYPFIMLLPHNPTSWSVSGYDALKELIDKIVDEYNINSKKISITGTSNGGTGLWKFVDKYPDLPSALYIVSSGLAITSSQAEKFKNIPINGISETSGGRYIVMSQNCKLINEFNGNSNCKVTERSDRTHDNILEIAYPKSVFEWMIKQTK